MISLGCLVTVLFFMLLSLCFFTVYVVFLLIGVQGHGCVVITQNFVSRYELMECIAKLSFLSSHLPTGLDHSFLVDLAFDSEAQYPKANSPDCELDVLFLKELVD